MMSRNDSFGPVYQLPPTPLVYYTIVREQSYAPLLFLRDVCFNFFFVQTFHFLSLPYVLTSHVSRYRFSIGQILDNVKKDRPERRRM